MKARMVGNNVFYQDGIVEGFLCSGKATGQGKAEVGVDKAGFLANLFQGGIGVVAIGGVARNFGFSGFAADVDFAA